MRLPALQCDFGKKLYTSSSWLKLLQSLTKATRWGDDLGGERGGPDTVHWREMDQTVPRENSSAGSTVKGTELELIGVWFLKEYGLRQHC